MVTRGQKRRIEQGKEEEVQKYKEKEIFVEEGSGKNNKIKEQEQEDDADTEETLSDCQSASDELFEGWRNKLVEKSKEMEEKQVREWSKEGIIEEEDSLDIQDDDTLIKPNFIWNKSKETRRDKCYFGAHEQYTLFGKDMTIRQPFYTNTEGFILQHHPSEGQNRVYIPDSKLQISGEHYYMHTLLFHAAH